MSKVEILKFDIWGETATFTIPIKNDKKYTNMHIHKPCILGILGGIIGIVEDTNIKDAEPNYQKNLKNLLISIVPKKPTFPKFIDSKTNTTGCFNKGDTYVNEIEMLLRPCWEVYIKNDNSNEYKRIKDFLLNGKSYIRPYLGTNWNFADINNIDVLEGMETDLEDEEKIDSLFPINDNFEYGDETYYFEEHMPIQYECIELRNEKDKKIKQWQYNYVNMCLTDGEMYSENSVDLIKCNSKSLYFI
ncbi:CRISPR-associated protein Cas5 [Clostridium ihumii]|uniref:CRISPR-associated protein Cas5 n=1 Tax=Clostridium ihumii TaxID=1470356 RepID=UPI003D332668